MGIFEFARKYLFWTVDFLNGGGIRKHYMDIRFVHENFASENARRRKKKSLQNLLDHTIKTVPFYQGLKLPVSLSDFPIIDKALVRDNYDLFRSQAFIKKKQHEVVTSGSTGNPFKVYHDQNKRNRSTADTIFYGKKAGFEIGSRLYYFRLWDKQYRKSTMLSWIQNVVMHSVDDFNEAYLSNVVDQMENDLSVKGILGYSSGLQSICKHLDNTGKKIKDCKVKTVISMAESLNDYTRDAIKRHFKVTPVSRYSNSENGIIAQQNQNEADNRDYMINWASYHVEILAMNEDIPLPFGETGRIVVTDLFNSAMPLIRYDTGDVGSLGYDDEDPDKPMVFAQIEGRKMDMFTNTKGEYVSPHIIHQILQYDQIDQFQFVQEGASTYIIKLKLLNRFDYNNEAKLIDQYKEYFGNDAKIKVEYVNEIPLLLSGKRKLVINNAIDKLNSKSVAQAHEQEEENMKEDSKGERCETEYGK
ncbi:phenylacetate--CoA ligase family protein [Flagellimonas sp. 389]|uniref:CoF synthetase n=1 Tax=Flagellimonas sp. 389 TaxID=2835862 RepID=UPI001BD5A0F9|nr:CoF synthetase [Flagellimonas sp. 389]MBS9462211.1 phenylacetate--CoA ligase family protein [Flagellimonas sp. 389]